MGELSLELHDRNHMTQSHDIHYNHNHVNNTLYRYNRLYRCPLRGNVCLICDRMDTGLGRWEGGRGWCVASTGMDLGLP